MTFEDTADPELIKRERRAAIVDEKRESELKFAEMVKTRLASEGIDWNHVPMTFGSWTGATIDYPGHRIIRVMRVAKELSYHVDGEWAWQDCLADALIVAEVKPCSLTRLFARLMGGVK